MTFLNRSTTIGNVLRAIPLLVGPIFTLSAVIHIAIYPLYRDTWGSLSFVAGIPAAWVSGALSFHLRRRQRNGKRSIAANPDLLGCLDASLAVGFTVGLICVIAAMIGARGRPETLVMGAFAIQPLCLGILVHTIFFIKFLKTVRRRYAGPHCASCGADIRRRARGEAERPAADEHASVVYESLLGEEGEGRCNEETVMEAEGKDME